MLDVLDNRERVIIEDYFGLTGNTRTLEDIGGDFSLTKERVRQIKEKGSPKVKKRNIKFVRLYVKLNKGCIYKSTPFILG